MRFFAQFFKTPIDIKTNILYNKIQRILGKEMTSLLWTTPTVATLTEVILIVN